MLKILQYILKVFSQMIIWKYQPEIIGITGSVGKTSTKEAIYRVLKKQFKVRRNLKNYNNQIGVPLTIIGSQTGGKSFYGWLKVFVKAISLILFRKKYPRILVLEMGIDRPGDMKYLLSFVPVKIGIITAIGEFPSHIEFFPEKGKLTEEKAQLVKKLPKGGLAILNYDDLTVRMIGDELPDGIGSFYYGFGEGADLQIINWPDFINNPLPISRLNDKDFSLNFKLEHKGSIVPIKLERILCKQYAFAATAGAAVGLNFGMNLVNIASALKKYRSLPGRANLIEGIKKTWIIDDSYNASPLATIAALEILEGISLEGGKKIAVLGDMMELGQYTEEGHRAVGKKAAAILDMLFTIGDRARFIADEAQKNGFPQEKIFSFSQADEAGLKVQKKIKKGDIILIKGSRVMHLEKIVKEIMGKPQKADKLLVQS